MHPIVRALGVALLVVVPLTATGCGKAAEKVAEKAAEKAIESQGGEGADVDLGSDGKIEIKTADGSYSAGTGEVPKGWPDDVGLPEGLEIATGSDIVDGASALSSVAATTEQDPEALIGFFEDELSGWEAGDQVSSDSDGSTFRSVSFTLDDRVVQVIATRDAQGQTTLSVTHQTAAPG